MGRKLDHILKGVVKIALGTALFFGISQVSASDLEDKVNPTINDKTAINISTEQNRDSSPLEDKIELIQAGFQKGFTVLDGIHLNPKIITLNRRIFRDSNININGVSGVSLRLDTNTTIYDKLNLSGKASGALFGFYSDFPYFKIVWVDGETEISYDIETELSDIQPYVISQFTFLPSNGEASFAPKLSEFNLGSVFRTWLGRSRFSIEPYFAQRILEHEFGGYIGIESEYFGLNVGGSSVNADYSFSPIKQNLNSEIIFYFQNIKLKTAYEINRTDYEGKMENSSNLSLGCELKF